MIIPDIDQKFCINFHGQKNVFTCKKYYFGSKGTSVYYQEALRRKDELTKIGNEIGGVISVSYITKLV